MRFEKEVNIYEKESTIKRLKAQDTKIEVVQGKMGALFTESELEELNNSHVTMYSKLAEYKAGVDGLEINITNMQTDMTDLKTWKSTVDVKISDSSIISTVTSSSAWGEKTTATDVESIIEQKADSIRLKADKISWQSLYSSMSEAGVLACQNANITGTITSSNATITGGKINISTSSETDDSISLEYHFGNGQCNYEWKSLFSPSKITIYEKAEYTDTTIYDNYSYESGFIGNEFYVCYNEKEYSVSKANSLIYASAGGNGRHIYISADLIDLRKPLSSGSNLGTLDIAEWYDVRIRGRLQNQGAKTSTSGSMVCFDGYDFARYSSSSRRYKRDITEIDEELNPKKLYDLPVHSYVYKDGYLAEGDRNIGKRMIGFIAEEVAEVYPQAATYNKDGTVEVWNVNIMVPAMLKMIQEQNEEIRKIRQQLKLA